MTEKRQQTADLEARILHLAASVATIKRDSATVLRKVANIEKRLQMLQAEVDAKRRRRAKS